MRDARFCAIIILGILVTTVFCVHSNRWDKENKMIREQYKKCDMVFVDGVEVEKDSVDPTKYEYTFEDNACFLTGERGYWTAYSPHDKDTDLYKISEKLDQLSGNN